MRWQDVSVSATDLPPFAPSPGETGLASWEPSDLRALVLPAWDDFLSIATELDLDGPTRVHGWTARDVCVHLGSWPGTRSLDRLRGEAERDELATEGRDTDPHATFDQAAHNEAVLEAWGRAPRTEVLAALHAARDEVTGFLDSGDAGALGQRRVRSVLGPLPMSTLLGAGAYELAVHALDLAPAGARPPSTELLSAGLAGLVDTTGALAARSDITATAGCVTPEGGWVFGTAAQRWTTLAMPEQRADWATVHGSATDLLDASAGRRAVPAMLARRELRMAHVSGLLALAPIIEGVPGLPGGAALQAAVRNVRGLGRLVRLLPGVRG